MVISVFWNGVLLKVFGGTLATMFLVKFYFGAIQICLSNLLSRIFGSFFHRSVRFRITDEPEYLRPHISKLTRFLKRRVGGDIEQFNNIKPDYVPLDLKRTKEKLDLLKK